MKRLSYSLKLLVVVTLAWTHASGEDLNFSMERRRFLRGSGGVLRLDDSGITFDAQKRKDSRTWPFRDIRHAELRSAKRLVLHTYGDRYDFRLREGEIDQRAYRFLAGRIPRGVTSRVLFPATEFLYELPAKHRHLFGGCEGVIRISSGLILYDTPELDHRRMWRIQDVRSFGTTGAHDLRLTMNFETFNFGLKVPLTQGPHDFLWRTVNEANLTPKGERE